MHPISWFLFIFLSFFGINGYANFYSQAAQDQFAYTLLYKLSNKQDAGYYVEIGAYHPTFMSNTFYFEKNYSWKGISIDISTEYEHEWHRTRNNPLLIADATQIDYRLFLKDFPQVIDYLSIDIDDQYDAVLRKIPFDEHNFRIITIEHDGYRYGDKYRNIEREILISHGYHLICPDVRMSDHAFEDWWIYPNAFEESLYLRLKSLDLNAKEYRDLSRLLDLL